MIKDLYYKNSESPVIKHKVRASTGDRVKREGDSTVYVVEHLFDSDVSIYYGTCSIIDTETYTKGFNTISVSDLIFVDRGADDF